MASPLRILIRSAAGPRIGYGHLVRARTLSRALEAEVHVSVRGGRASQACGRRLGLTIADRSLRAAIRAVRPAVVVIDEPSAAHAHAALAAVRAAGLPAASIHDLGIAPLPSDLAIDGSIGPADRRGDACAGPRFAVIDPWLVASAPRRRRTSGVAPRVLVALGGGPRAALAALIARATQQRVPDARIRVAAGLERPRGDRALTRGITWLGPLPSLARELRACDVAVVAGGVTLYEACALGVATVALPVVAAQQPTVDGFAARGAVLAAPLPSGARSVSARIVAEHVAALLSQPAAARHQARMARAIVDGRGALRVARALRELASRSAERWGRGEPCTR